MNISEQFEKVKEASREMVLLTDEKIKDVLILLKESIYENMNSLLLEN